MPTAQPVGAYDFSAPGRITFGWGRRSEVGVLARPLGKRALIVCGSRTLIAAGIVEELRQHLARAGVSSELAAGINREPTVEDVDAATDRLLEANAAPGDLVLAIGGGSAIDLAKAVAALVTNRQGTTVLDYLEGVGSGLTIEHAPLPVLAMPTTAGAGSEATKNAVISSYDPPFKKSLRSERMVPRAVLVDPELTVTTPAPVTAHTGLDAITQLIESYISRRSRPIPRAIARDALAGAVPALLEAVADGRNRAARETMAHAALLSGMALANSGLGLAHGVAAALGTHCRVPHGLACAVMLPVAMRVNLATSAERLAELAPAITGRADWSSSETAADAAVERISQLCAELQVPRGLSQLGVRREQLSTLAPASRGNSMDGNPRELSDEELIRMLEEAW
jgi:alcohol dehydrogenase class IV